MDEVPTIAMESVRDILVSPYSAVFSDVSVYHLKSRNLYLVFGNVDSQNGFGAMLRNKFSRCYRPEGQSLIDISDSLSSDEYLDILNALNVQMSELTERLKQQSF